MTAIRVFRPGDDQYDNVMYSRYCDQYGKPVDRTPESHPYTYDSYLLHRILPNEDVTGGVYSDRLYQENYELTSSLIKKHCGSESQMWDRFTVAQLQSFLRERLARPNLELAYVMQCCNQASGYPLWYLAYKDA
jgi:hypothetical protein